MQKQWDESLSTGVGEIDSQHREFISALNRLMDAMSAGRGRDEVMPIISFIGEYTEKHFSTEEEYMRRYMYPGYEEHRLMHEGFRREFSGLRSEADGNTGIKLVLRVEKNMLAWLINHIRDTDKKLGAFLKGRV